MVLNIKNNLFLIKPRDNMVTATAKDSDGTIYIFIFEKRIFQSGSFRNAHMGQIVSPPSHQGRKIVVKLQRPDVAKNDFRPDLAVSKEAGRLVELFTSELKNNGVNIFSIIFCQPIIGALLEFATTGIVCNQNNQI